MSMIKPIIGSFQFTNQMMSLVLSDLTNEQATQRSRNGVGSSISWIVAHLLDHRHQAINLFRPGVERRFKSFSDESATDGSNYPKIEEMRNAWTKTASDLESVLSKVTDEELMLAVSAKNSPHNEKARIETLVFHMWHESYHTGVLGSLRKDLGLPSTSDLAIAAQSAS